jgi:hypothetical protein
MIRAFSYLARVIRVIRIVQRCILVHAPCLLEFGALRLDEFDQFVTRDVQFSGLLSLVFAEIEALAHAVAQHAVVHFQHVFAAGLAQQVLLYERLQ